jgi:McrBC 5-methylcytosine restriction system component
VLRLKAQTWSELEIFYEDVALTPDDLRDLGWLKTGVARAQWGRASLRLSIGPYVGRLVVPGRCVIDIHELVPGTVAALLPLCYSGLRWFREPAAMGPVRIEPWAALLEPYGDALRSYTRRGAERRYVPQQWDTQFPRGRIDLGRTLLTHRSRGRADVVACDVRYLTDDTPINQLLLSAALRAEAALGSGGHDLALRRLREAIAGLRGVSWSLAPDIPAARRDLSSRRDDALVLLVDLAEMIVSGVGLVAEEIDVGEQPVSVWLNVEHIFERAIRRLVRELSSGDVRSGVGDGVKLLTHGEDLDADPDIVVVHPQATAVLDAKYRRHGSAVSRDEIYQLIAHANAYSAAFAALVTPRISSSDSDRYLGLDPDGRRFDVLAVDATRPTDIVETLTDWLSENGLR